VSSYTSNDQRHEGLTYRLFVFDIRALWRTGGTLVYRAERQSAGMSETKNGRLGLYGKV